MLQGSDPVRIAVIYGIRGLFGLLALLAASSGSTLPLYAAAALGGILLIGLPLRRFPEPQFLSVLAWLPLFALFAAHREDWITSATRDVFLAGLIGLACLAVVFEILAPLDMRSSDVARRPIAVALGCCLASLLMAAVIAIGLISPPDRLTRALMIIAALAGSGAVAGAALTGLIRGVSRVTYSPAFHAPRPLRAPQLRQLPDRHVVRRTSGFADRALAILVAVSMRVTARLVQSINLALRLAWRSVNTLRRISMLVLHLVKKLILRVVYTLGAAGVDAAKALLEAAAFVVIVGACWLRSSLLSLALLIVMALAAVTAAERFTTYLAGGSLLDAFATFAWVGIALAACAVLWSAMTAWPMAVVAGAARRNFECGGVTVFITLVVLGWVGGLLGILGLGALRPGVLTVAGTLVLVTLSVVVFARNRIERVSLT